MQTFLRLKAVAPVHPMTCRAPSPEVSTYRRQHTPSPTASLFKRSKPETARRIETAAQKSAIIEANALRAFHEFLKKPTS
jgi:hypothetical protein